MTSFQGISFQELAPHIQEYLLREGERRRQEKIKAEQRKNAAHAAVYAAIYRGDLSAPATQLCRGDGCERMAQEYHHESYAEEDWLNVTPLCRSCHRKRHRKQKSLNS